MPPIFTSRDTAYRDPFGAVPDGTPVHFRLCVPREWGCHAAYLRMREEGRLEHFDGMFWAGMADDTHEWWECHFAPGEPGLYWYDFVLDTNDGRRQLRRLSDGSAQAAFESESRGEWQLTCYERGFTTPDWLVGGVMYQIFPDRFCRSDTPKEGVPQDRVLHERWGEPPVWQPNEQGLVLNNDYFGGDLRGIEQRLDYLAALGVTCLYLNPVFEAHSNHRYDTADRPAARQRRGLSLPGPVGRAGGDPDPAGWGVQPYGRGQPLFQQTLPVSGRGGVQLALFPLLSLVSLYPLAAGICRLVGVRHAAGGGRTESVV